MYIYFVVFEKISNFGHGTYNSRIKLFEPITDLNQIRMIESELNKRFLGEPGVLCVITNFILLRTEEHKNEA